MNKLALTPYLVLGFLLLCWPQRILAQAPGTDQSQDSCKSCIDADLGLCHFSIAMVLLERNDHIQPQCQMKQRISPTVRGSDEGIQLAIGELEKAKGIAFSVSPESIDIFRAGAFLKLGQSYLRKGEANQAAQAFSSAQKIYRAQLQDASKPDNIATMAIGLLRSGDPINSIVAATKLNQHSAMKTYLIAEALFSLGDREGAAIEYTAWIDEGCASSPIALTADDYGESQGAYLLSTNKTLGVCRQLPVELRARLEALRDQTGALKNLPKVNDAPPFYRPHFE